MAEFRAGGAVGSDVREYLYHRGSFTVATELRDIAMPKEVRGGPPRGRGGPPPGEGGPPEEFPGPDWLTPPPWQDEAGAESIDERSVREFRTLGGSVFSHTDLVRSPVSKRRTSYYHADLRGSTMMLSGAGGEPVAAYHYDAFGTLYGEHPAAGAPQPTVPEVARPAVERGTRYLYTGKRLDPETGHYDYGLRDYASRLARFTTVDPVKDGRNWYAYVGGDPVNRVDPLGLYGADLGRAGDGAADLPGRPIDTNPYEEPWSEQAWGVYGGMEAIGLGGLLTYAASKGIASASAAGVTAGGFWGVIGIGVIGVGADLI
jgi:RHS repeat-associated protein